MNKLKPLVGKNLTKSQHSIDHSHEIDKTIVNHSSDFEEMKRYRPAIVSKK